MDDPVVLALELRGYSGLQGFSRAFSGLMHLYLTAGCIWVPLFAFFLVPWKYWHQEVGAPMRTFQMPTGTRPELKTEHHPPDDDNERPIYEFVINLHFFSISLQRLTD